MGTLKELQEVIIDKIRDEIKKSDGSNFNLLDTLGRLLGTVLSFSYFKGGN